MISPKNYFLFTPLLPSVAVGTLNPRSIIQRAYPALLARLIPTELALAATRYVTRHKARQVSVIEASATEVDVSITCPRFASQSLLTANSVISVSRSTRLLLLQVRWPPRLASKDV